MARFKIGESGKQGYYTDRDDEGTHIMCDRCGEYIGTAEEIAATLDGGECEITNCDSGEMDIDVYALSCGHVAYYPAVYEEPPAFCPECGKAVRR